MDVHDWGSSSSAAPGRQPAPREWMIPGITQGHFGAGIVLWPPPVFDEREAQNTLAGHDRTTRPTAARRGVTRPALVWEGPLSIICKIGPSGSTFRPIVGVVAPDAVDGEVPKATLP